jgi:hypothetical protein
MSDADECQPAETGPKVNFAAVLGENVPTVQENNVAVSTHGPAVVTVTDGRFLEERQAIDWMRDSHRAS